MFLTQTNFKNALSTRDYQFASPGNLLEKLAALRSIAKKNLKKLWLTMIIVEQTLRASGKEFYND